MGESDRLEGFVTNVLAAPKRYELHAVLIPAVKAILAALVPDSPDRNSFDLLLQHCLAELRTATAAPIEPPADWSRDANIDCKCVDCLEMARFLCHPTEQVHRFPRRKELRQHLHVQIDKHRLDLTHVTLRTGSPQTLVCTKNQATYERRRAQFDVDAKLLNELEDLATAKTTRRDAPSSSQAQKSLVRGSAQEIVAEKVVFNRASRVDSLRISRQGLRAGVPLGQTESILQGVKLTTVSNRVNRRCP